MKNQILIHEAITSDEIDAFWEQLYTYFKRDIFPDPSDEDRAYFLSQAYRTAMQGLHDRPQNRAYYLLFRRAGQDIGFAMPVFSGEEDGKCFLMEFCVYPEFRGNGTGRACAMALLDWAREMGGIYAELNYGGDDRRCRFWQGIGFVKNGVDEWGNPLMLLPPTHDLPVFVEVLSDAEDWQLMKLENGFLSQLGEQALSEERQEQLRQAIREGRITFFLAKWGCRSVGMCSVRKCFSAYSCADTGVFGDFYIEPVFRKRGIARRLAKAAQDWCEEQGVSELSVCCVPCDEEMYRSLGFSVPLGKIFACLF